MKPNANTYFMVNVKSQQFIQLECNVDVKIGNYPLKEYLTYQGALGAQNKSTLF